MKRRSALALASAVVASLPTAAEAHLNSTGMGPIYDGAVHFATSPGDLLSALALALLAGLRGREHGRRAMFVLAGAWLVGSLVGSAAPVVANDALASATWLLVLGGLLALDVELSLRGITALAACVGLAHGFLNGTGLGWSASSLTALVGLAASVFALAALASALVVDRTGWPRIAVRVLGSWIVASGILWLGWAVKGSG